MSDSPTELGLVRAEDCVSSTAQSPGMNRRAGISASTVGSSQLFMGSTTMAPHTTSGAHHHGISETAIYVVAGTPTFVFLRDGEEVRLRTRPGDYVYVPPFVPHIEDNDGDTEAVVVLARTTQEAIVENLPHL